jgi:hypothetical protein
LYQIEDADHNESDTLYAWLSLDNPDLNLVERIRRRVELHEISFDLGYSQPNSRAELKKMLNLLDDYQITNTKPKKIIYQLNAEKN